MYCSCSDNNEKFLHSCQNRVELLSNKSSLTRLQPSPPQSKKSGNSWAQNCLTSPDGDFSQTLCPSLIWCKHDFGHVQKKKILLQTCAIHCSWVACHEIKKHRAACVASYLKRERIWAVGFPTFLITSAIFLFKKKEGKWPFLSTWHNMVQCLEN